MTTLVMVANDIGTTAVKTIGVYQSRPNSSNKIEYMAVLGETKDQIGIDSDLMEVTTEDGQWFVGESVIRHRCKNPIWGRGDKWPLSIHYKALHLYSIARHIGSTTPEVDVNLVSALPRADYKMRDEVANILKGTHTVKIPGRANALKVNIVDVYFSMQGLSAIMAEGYTQDKMVAWLGLGGRNKTYATIRDGIIDPDKTNSTEGGLLDVIDKLRDRIGQKHNIEMPVQEWIKALQNKSIPLGNGPLDITEYAEVELKEYVSSTFSLIDGVWNDRSDMPFISDFRIGGGGALEIGGHIEQRYRKARVVNNPRWTEAEGLIKMGMARYL